MDAILGNRMPVPPALRRWVAGISVGPAGDGPVVTRLPDAATALVLRRTTAGDADLAVLGPRTRAAYFTGRDATFSLGLRIQPGRARLVLGRPATAIVDRCLPLGELWGDAGARLAGELADPGLDPAAALRHLESTLVAHLTHRPAIDLSRSDLVYRAAQALAAAADVRGTARRLHISERHLRDLFTSAVGVAPKRFARIHRIRTVLARISHTTIARLVTEAGYYDQSHLTAEFRDLMGVPPGAYLAGRLPAAACSRDLPG